MPIDRNRSEAGKRKGRLLGVLFAGAVLLSIGGYRAMEDRRAEVELKSAEKTLELERAKAESAAVPIPAAVPAEATEFKTDWYGEISFADDALEWQGVRYKKDSTKKAILCLGVDRTDDMQGTRELGHAGQADGIFLIIEDTARHTAKLLMIPRDTMTEIYELRTDGTWGNTVDHLTLAFGYGDGEKGSCESTRDAVSKLLFDLPIDHYYAFDLKAMGALTDAVGGVEVTVPTDGMEKADPSFIKGETLKLKGSQAEKFLRFRDLKVDNSPILRMGQHREFINGFYRSLKETQRTDSNIVTELFDLMKDSSVTDMPKDVYLKAALDLTKDGSLPDGTILYLPGTSRSTLEFDQFYMDQGQAIPLLLSLFCRKAE